MCSSSPPKPAPAPAVPQMVAPIEADTGAESAGSDERRRRKAASGRSETILTSGLGVQGQAVTGGKKTLGG